MDEKEGAGIVTIIIAVIFLCLAAALVNKCSFSQECKGACLSRGYEWYSIQGGEEFGLELDDDCYCYTPQKLETESN